MNNYPILNQAESNLLHKSRVFHYAFILLLSLYFLLSFEANAQSTVSLPETCASCPVINSPGTNGTSVVSSYGAPACTANSITGTMTGGTAVSGVTMQLYANVTTLGTYSLTAGPTNGVTFAGSGSFTALGCQLVTLTATGTPTAEGTNTFTTNTSPAGYVSATTVSGSGPSSAPSTNGTGVASAYSCSISSGGMMYEGSSTAGTGVSQTITVTVTTVGTYSLSATANGVTFAANGTFAGTGAQTIVLTATGTPTAAGTNAFALNTTPGCSFNRTTGTPLVDIISSTGQIWMDRNLGATQAATSATDALSFGDLYQWGRAADGHQLRTSAGFQVNVAYQASQSTTVSANADKFFYNINSSAWYNGSKYDIIDMWQGVAAGVNNPCPPGYRIPTQTEFAAEVAAYSINSVSTAFASPLKLPSAGFRNVTNGVVTNGSFGFYWTSTHPHDNRPTALTFPSNPSLGVRSHGMGYSVRCIKD